MCCGAIAGGTIATPIRLSFNLYVLCSLQRGFNAISLFVLGVVGVRLVLFGGLEVPTPGLNQYLPSYYNLFQQFRLIIHSFINNSPKHTNMLSLNVP